MDLNLVDGIKNGDLTVFNSVYRLYHEQIYSFIYHKTQSDFIAAEVVQLTFIKLWEHRAVLSHDVAMNVQLFGMARQVMINELRKEATRFKYNNQSDQSPFSDNLIRMIESRDMLKHFEDEIENMPKIRKLVFNLSRKQGLSHKEIAEILSISPKTVENHIGKVLSRLKQYMYTIFF